MTEPSHSKPASSGKLRKTILFGTLFLLVIGLIYDYQVARPGVNQAYDKIVEKSTQVNMSSTSIFTNKDLQQLLAKEPSRTFSEANGDYVEVYSWRSGLPIRTHDLFAVYKKSGDNWLFHRHAKFKHEGSTDISKFDGAEPLQVKSDGESPPDPAADASRVGSAPDTSAAAPDDAAPSDAAPDAAATSDANADAAPDDAAPDDADAAAAEDPTQN